MSDNPSIVSNLTHCTNFVHIPEDATQEEKEIHAFLDESGIFQINV
jgi:hypothetical protein